MCSQSKTITNYYIILCFQNKTIIDANYEEILSLPSFIKGIATQRALLQNALELGRSLNLKNNH